jgi:hypothetical protein
MTPEQRIAELERENEQLLTLVAEYEDRLKVIHVASAPIGASDESAVHLDE